MPVNLARVRTVVLEVPRNAKLAYCLLRDDRVGNAFFRYVGPRLPRVNTLEQAGAQLASVAIGPRPAEPGAYIDRWDVTQSSLESYDERREEELWSAAERLTARAIA